MRKVMVKRLKLIGVIFFLFIFFLLFGRFNSFILTIPITIFIFILLIFSKGKWEKNINKEEAKKWRKSAILTFYTILLVIHSILFSYLWINIPPSISHEPANYLNSLDNLNTIVFVFFINIVFISFLMWKKAPKQILSLPIISIILFTIPGFVNSLIWEIATRLYLFSILPILNIIWAIYIRFVFLRKDKIVKVKINGRNPK